MGHDSYAILPIWIAIFPPRPSIFFDYYALVLHAPLACNFIGWTTVDSCCFNFITKWQNISAFPSRYICLISLIYFLSSCRFKFPLTSELISSNDWKREGPLRRHSMHQCAIADAIPIQTHFPNRNTLQFANSMVMEKHPDLNVEHGSKDA